MQEIDDRLRRPGRGQDAGQRVGLLAGKACLGHRRHVRKARHALVTGHHQGAQRALLDLLCGGRQGGEGDRRVATHRVLDRRAGTGELHRRQVEALRDAEDLAREMRRAADAGRSVAVLVRGGLDELHQLLHRLGWNGRMHRHHVRRHGNQADGREVLHRIIGHLGEQTGVHDQAGAGDDQRVAVGGPTARRPPCPCCRRRRGGSRHRTACRGSGTACRRRRGR